MNIIVTGASRGIGYETVKKLAEQGHIIIGTARSSELLNELEHTNPEQIHTFPADLTDQQSISQFIGQIKDVIPHVDALINNAGALVNKPFKELTIEEWKQMMDVNLYSAIRLINAVIPMLSEHAHIVNISSMGGFQGSSKFPGLSAYSVAKGALSILTECLTVELADHHIKVNALCLGAVETEMFNQAFPEFNAPLTAEQMGAYLADFAVNGSTYYNGRILPVALADPG